MASPPFSPSSTWSVNLSAMIDQLRSETIRLALLTLGVAALALLSYLPTYRDHPGRLALIAALLFLLAFAVWRCERTNYRLAAGLLVGGTMTAIGLMVLWIDLQPALYLAILPAGLATLLLTRKWGALTATTITLAILFAPQGVLALSWVERVIATSAIWSVVGLVVLTVRPLVNTVEWAWSGYERSQQLLGEARDYQVQLHEALQDLTAANTQLTRLNVQAEGLRQLAEDARRAKEQFVSNVSHELRTPLNMIIGFSEMIVGFPQTYGKALPATLLADLEVVLRNSRHLADLVNDVLDLSQIETGQMALSKEWVDLANIIEAAVIAVRPLYESKGLYLHTEIANDLPQVFCDRTRIREVLLNLLSNAGRFTQQGGVGVRAWQQGDAVLVSVSDTGPGIAGADQDRIFQPFQQLDGSIRRKYGGTGLGLSISRGFIERHEGKLWLESRSGEGSTFTFRLPLNTPAPANSTGLRWIDPYQNYEPRTRPAHLPAGPVHARIITVETGQALQRLLNRYGEDLDVLPARDLEEAAAELAQAPVQAILVNRPHSGTMIEEITHWRALPYGVPVFVAAIPEAGAGVSQLGVAEYLVKPVSREQLMSALGSLKRAIKTVLVVDDDEETLQLFRRMLASLSGNYRVLRAADGRQALAVARQRHPDVILLDLIMPEMDGFAFLAAKAEDAGLRDIPVILLSAQDPYGQPIMSQGLTVTCKDGLSLHQLLMAFSVLRGLLGLGSGPGDPTRPAEPRA
jgi:signal transduction histidine kinase/CheY-like chemotaxis protein